MNLAAEKACTRWATAAGAGIALALAGAGFAAAWFAQELRHDEARVTWSAIAAVNVELRASAETMRRRCPLRPRFQRKAYRPGEMI